MELRRRLIDEEANESIEAFNAILGAGPDEDLKPLYRDLIKELADILVVVYGAFAAIGVDADAVYEAVMNNNFGKLGCSTVDEGGKLIPDPEAKARLKAEITAQLLTVFDEDDDEDVAVGPV